MKIPRKDNREIHSGTFSNASEMPEEKIIKLMEETIIRVFPVE